MEEIKEVKFAPGLTADILFVELQSQGREYLRLMSYYSSAMLEVETKFKVLNIEFSNKFDRNPIESIETRLKKPRSIYEKMNRLGLPISVDAIEKNLNDIAGVRGICSFVDDIYKLGTCWPCRTTYTSFERRITSKIRRKAAIAVCT